MRSSQRRIAFSFEQSLALYQAGRIVQPEQICSSPASGRLPGDSGAFQRKMLAPGLSAGIEDGNNRAIRRVNGCKVRTFVAVAIEAGQREIAFDSLAAVFERNEMIEVMGERRIVLMNQTVFTPPVGSLDHELAERRWDMDPAHGLIGRK